jgi:tight adherence protein B
MQGVLLLLIAMSVAAAAFTVLSAFSDSGRDQLAKRAKTLGVTDRRKRLPRPGPQLRRDRHSSLDLLLHRLVPRPNVLRARLNSSGTGLTIGTYGLLCLAVALVATIVLLIKGLPALPGILLGLTLGLWLPHMAVGFLIGRRRKRFLKLLPQAIGLLVRGLKAGLPVTETMLVIGREVGDPIGEEFRRIGDQVKLGQSLEDALWSVARRYDLPEFNFLVITLSVQRETGGNLAETLGNLDEILRKRQQMQMKVKAMSSEAKASAGIIGSLPFIMMAVLYSVSHDYIMMLFTTALGHIMLVGGGISMAIGVFVMMQMTRFEI